jgi:hypothetical protein
VATRKPVLAFASNPPTTLPVRIDPGQPGAADRDLRRLRATGRRGAAEVSREAGRRLTSSALLVRDNQPGAGQPGAAQALRAAGHGTRS